ncbi:MAG: YceI family protein [Leptospiraceae bacterium]|nr:YceI family protein [Leptospiraceae bacterium]
MNKKFYLLPLLIVTTLFLFCGKKQPLPKNCTFEYDESTVDLTWTAYKFTERAGVAGKFNKIQLTETHVADHPAKVFEGARFLLKPEDINSNNADRDKKIKKEFFGSLKNAGEIQGYFSDVDVAGNKGAAKITINGIEKDIPLTFTVGDDYSIQAEGKIDMTDFGGLGAIAALNKVCDDLHKGKDGISKLWPDVGLKLTAKPKTECKPAVE